MAGYYETNRLLNEYLLMHYGSTNDLMPWNSGPKDAIGFPTRTIRHFPHQSRSGRALDLGCAVGRSSFELSKTCSEVIGIDFSSTFIAAANQLLAEGTIDYEILETGKTTRSATATIPEDSHPDRVSFLQGDAMNLPENLGKFDRIHAANLICRLPEPDKLLQRIPELLTPHGHLVLATPCTWLDEFTPPQHQPGDNTFDWLQNRLSHALELVSTHDEPFLIRETARKYQWTVSMVTVWTLKS